ncbi:MAG: hypothetical protein V3U27_14195 [Candidatus Tectomicrobia bacterium]
MLSPRDVPHEHTDLAGVDFSPVAAPLPFNPDRVRAAFGEATGIEGDDAIGFAQAISHFSNQHVNQGAMVPRGNADEVLDDLSLHIDPRRDVLGILALQMG